MSNERKLFYEDVITFPATKTAAAVTLESDEYNQLETAAYGEAHIFLKADNVSFVSAANTLLIKPYVSFDSGATWKLAGSYTEFSSDYTTTTFSVLKSLACVPTMKIDAVFNGSATLTTGHGLSIDLELVEKTSGYRRQIFTYNGGFSVTQATTTFAGRTSTAFTISNMHYDFTKANIITTLDGAEFISNALNYKLQSSWDGTNWFTASPTYTMNAGSAYYNHTSISDGDTYHLGKYVRFMLDTTGTISLHANHNISFNLVMEY